jgi:hypothetical protein
MPLVICTHRITLCRISPLLGRFAAVRHCYSAPNICSSQPQTFVRRSHGGNLPLLQALRTGSPIGAMCAAMQMCSRAAPVGGCGALVGEHGGAKPGGSGMTGAESGPGAAHGAGQEPQPWPPVRLPQGGQRPGRKTRPVGFPGI